MPVPDAAPAPTHPDAPPTHTKPKNHNIHVSTAILTAASQDNEALLQSLRTNPQGLTQTEAAQRTRTSDFPGLVHCRCCFAMTAEVEIMSAARCQSFARSARPMPVSGPIAPGPTL